MSTFTKVSYTNASPRGTGDNRLNSIPAKAKHVNDLIDGLEQGRNPGPVVTKTSGVVTLDLDTKTLIPAISVPAGSLITNYFIVTTTLIACGNGIIGWQIGTAADGEELAAADPNGISAAVTALAVGKGASTKAGMNTALAGQAQIVPVAASLYRAAATDVHFTLDFAAAVTAGAMICGVQFVAVL